MRQSQSSVVLTSLPEATQPCNTAIKDFFAPFANQGKLDAIDRIHLAIVRLISAAGVPPTIADYPKWELLFLAIAQAPRLLKFGPPSSTTLCDKLIPAESQQINKQMRRYLSGQRNLTVSFDGLTQGQQPVFTVHVITPERHVFLLWGNVYYGSHTSSYVEDVLDRVSSVLLQLVLIEL
jgi:hypothetical protein